MNIQKVDSIELSQYIVSKIGKINHLKLQKLVYYVEAYHLAYFDQSIIDDEFEAWLHGPVSRKLWDHLKPMANVYDFVKIKDEAVDRLINEFKSKVTPEQLDFINDVLEEFGGLTSYKLECLTHNEDPWKLARKGYMEDEKCEEIIDKNIMRSYYKKKLYNEQI